MAADPNHDLDLHHQPIDVPTVVQQLQASPNLIRVRLEAVDFDFDELPRILQALPPTVEVLDLSRNPLTDIHITAMIHVLKLGHCPRELILFRCRQLTNQSLLALMQLPALRRLNFANVQIDLPEEDILTLVVQHSNLTHLNLRLNTITRNANIILQSQHLQVLNLSNNPLGWKHLHLIFGALNGNQVLTSLDVCSVLREVRVKQVNILVNSLTVNTNLTELLIGYQRFQPAAIQALFLHLAQNQTLRSLNLDQIEGLNDESLVLLQQGLTQNQTLQTLSLNRNWLTDLAAQHLATALQHNATLTTLNLASNQITDAGARALIISLQHNATLTTLNLGGNQIPEDERQGLIDLNQHRGALDLPLDVLFD